MVAIASLPTTVTSPGRVPRAAAPARRTGPGLHRPPLALVPGRRPARTLAGRSVASVVLAAVLALVVLLAAAYLVRTPTVSPGSAAGTTYLAAEGDTMWSIAVEHAPAGEAATYVEQLVAANGGAGVRAGQVLTLPTP